MAVSVPKTRSGKPMRPMSRSRGARASTRDRSQRPRGIVAFISIVNTEYRQARILFVWAVAGDL
jgi:hypothetical protein